MSNTISSGTKVNLSKSNGVNTQYGNVKQTKTMFQMFVVFIVTIFDVLPIAAHTLLSEMTAEGYTQTLADEDSGNDMNYFTIESLVKNDRQLFDANFFNFETKSSTNNKFKESVAIWYNALKQLALILSLVVLIYIGIRMALSTIASDKAMYKKMLISWFEGILLIWLMPYILTIAMTLSDVIVTFIKNSVGQTKGFELEIIDNFYTYLENDVHYRFVLWSIAYWILVSYQLRFLIAYAKRFLSIGVLIMVSPIVCVTNAIDKAGDGRAQGVQTLFKELLVNIYIQPIHVIIFEVFIITANNIATKAPVIAIAFLFALARVEKIVKTVFNLRGLSSIHSIGHYLPIVGKRKGR